MSRALRFRNGRPASFLQRPFFAAAVSAALAFTSTGSATTIRDYTIDELLEESSLVARVRVVRAGYAVENSAVGLCTPVAFEVLDTLQGSWPRDRLLEFCLPGGLAPDGRFQMVSGAPMFMVDDIHWVFLQGGPWGLTPVVNWWNGSLREVQHRGRPLLVRADGQGVAAIRNDRFEPAGEIEPSSQMRFLRSLGVDIWMADGNVEGAGMLSEDEDSQRRQVAIDVAAGRSADRATILAGIRRRIATREGDPAVPIQPSLPLRPMPTPLMLGSTQ